MSKLRAFGAFWYDFVIGDDWLVAAGVVIGLAGTYGAAQGRRDGLVAASAGDRGAAAGRACGGLLVVLCFLGVHPGSVSLQLLLALRQRADRCLTARRAEDVAVGTRCSQFRSLTRSTSFSSSSA